MDWVTYFIQGQELLFLGLGTVWDIKDRELPVLLFVVFGGFGLFCNLLWKYQSLRELILGIFLGGAFLAVGFISGEQIGYGDGLGLMILGIFEGAEGLISMIIVSFLLGGIYGLWNIWGLKRSKSDTMPFYPFLLFAFVGVKIL